MKKNNSNCAALILILICGAFISIYHGTDAGKAFIDMCLDLYEQVKSFFDNLPFIFQ